MESTEKWVLLVVIILLVLIVTAIIILVLIQRPEVIVPVPIQPVIPTITQVDPSIPRVDAGDGCCKKPKKPHKKSSSSDVSSSQSSSSHHKRRVFQSPPPPINQPMVSGSAASREEVQPVRSMADSEATITGGNNHRPTGGNNRRPAPVLQQRKQRVIRAEPNTAFSQDAGTVESHHSATVVDDTVFSSVASSSEEAVDTTHTGLEVTVEGPVSHLRYYTDNRWRLLTTQVSIRKLQHTDKKLYVLSGNTVYHLSETGAAKAHIGSGATFPYDGYIDDFFIRDGAIFVLSDNEYYKLMTNGLEKCTSFPEALAVEVSRDSIYAYHDDGTITCDGIELQARLTAALDVELPLRWSNHYLYFVTNDGDLQRAITREESLDDVEPLAGMVRLFAVDGSDYAYITRDNSIYLVRNGVKSCVGTSSVACGLELTPTTLYVVCD